MKWLSPGFTVNFSEMEIKPLPVVDVGLLLEGYRILTVYGPSIAPGSTRPMDGGLNENLPAGTMTALVVKSFAFSALSGRKAINDCAPYPYSKIAKRLSLPSACPSKFPSLLSTYFPMQIVR